MPSVAIIDDEASSREVLKNLLAKLCPDVEIVGEAGGVSEGVALIRSKRPDAIFLDILMDDGMGFDLIKFFPSPSFNIIFTSGYNNYATEAFRANAMDYLLKPINPEELVKAVEKINAHPPGIDARITDFFEGLQNPEERTVRLPTGKGWVFWKMKHIIRLEAADSMTFFFNSEGKKVLVARTIRAAQDMLPDNLFFRCHKSHIINRKYIKEVLREDGSYEVLLEDGLRIPISRRRSPGFLDWLDNGG